MANQGYLFLSHILDALSLVIILETIALFLNNICYHPLLYMVLINVATYGTICPWDNVCDGRFVVCHLARPSIIYLHRLSERHLQTVACEKETAYIEPTNAKLGELHVM